MEFVAVVILVALVEYMFFGLATGQARQKYEVPAPATTGNPIFERTLRVQQNTLEQLIVFVPSIWIFATYINPLAAAVIGLVFIVGRALYSKGYVTDPEKRGTGFLVGFLANVILVLGSLVGVIVAWAT